MIEALVNLLYPRACLVCRRLGAPALCEECTRAVHPVIAPWCTRCGGPLAPEALGVCRVCARHPPPFATARSMGWFTGELRRAIHRLKFEGRKELGEPLGMLLARFVLSVPAFHRAHLIVPVPLHRLRQRARGYNHAALLARAVAESLHVPLSESLLIRGRATMPQTQLGRADRWQNVRGAFLVSAREGGLVYRREVLLIDDVMTSAATAVACAETLLAAGAAAVRVATLARAELHQWQGPAHGASTEAGLPAATPRAPPG